MATFKELLNKWNITGLSINTGFLQADISFRDADRSAAWEMYVELLTRVTTQNLAPEDGDEKTALTSVFTLFGLTREIIKRNGPECINFAKIAIVILNQVLRPFTAKWHKLSIEGAFDDKAHCLVFRQELRNIQRMLDNYTKSLADIAGVEDLTNIEEF